MSRARMDSFSLTADMMYVSSNAPRIARSVFEICLRRGWSATAELALRLCKVRRPVPLPAASVVYHLVFRVHWHHGCAGAEHPTAVRSWPPCVAEVRSMSAPPGAVRQAFEERLWSHQHPLRQFGNVLAPELLAKLEDRGLEMDQLQDMEAQVSHRMHLAIIQVQSIYYI